MDASRLSMVTRMGKNSREGWLCIRSKWTYLFVGSLDFFHRAQRSSIKSDSSTTTTILLLPMQEKASIINALNKSSSDGYHLGLLGSLLFGSACIVFSPSSLHRHKVTPHLQETLFVDSPSTLVASTHVC